MHYHHTRNPRTILMSLKAWLNKLRTKARHSQSKPPRRPSVYRPFLEPLEPRLVRAPPIWSGGDPFSSNWSANFNWQNGAVLPPVSEGDSVEFPADAKRRTNHDDINHPGDFVQRTVLHDLHIDGGDYSIDGFRLQLDGALISDAGANTIRNVVEYTGSQAGTIQVGSGSLALRGDLHGGRIQPSLEDLVKTGAG